MNRLAMLALLVCLPSSAAAQWDPRDVVPAEQRERFRNPDGSCVQCAIAMAGVDAANYAAECVLHGDPERGWEPIRGGSWPERVKRYCEKRNIAAWHIEGNTMPWIDWALRNGRTAAVTLTPAHMQWACNISEDGQTIYVVDNNSPDRVDEWPRAKFIRQHKIHGGGWCVILQGPRPVPWVAPRYVSYQSRSEGRHNETVADLFGSGR